MLNPKKKKLTFLQLEFLCYQLSIVMKSGMSLISGISLLNEELEDAELREVLSAVCTDLSGSSKIYEAFERQTVFPAYMVKMIQIGEYSGSLDAVMLHLSRYYKKMGQMNKQLKSAITYPLLLSSIMLVLIAFLLIKVLPMFQGILDSSGGDIPVFTAALFGISHAIKSYGLAATCVFIVLGTGGWIYLNSPKGKTHSDRLCLNAPFLSQLFKRIYALRFSETMAMLLKSGIGYSESLRMTAGVVGNVHLEAQIRTYSETVLYGEHNENFYKELNIFSGLLSKMIAIGHTTGELEAVMTELSEIYGFEIEMELKRLETMVEPMLMLILSVIVGAMLLGFMLPLINVMTALGN